MTRLPPLWIQAGSYAASVDRRLIGALWPEGGRAGMPVASDQLGIHVVVGPGAAVATVIDHGGTTTGACLCVSDNWEAVPLEAAPPGGTDRIDIVAVIPHSEDINGDPTNAWVYMVFPGTPAPDPIPNPNPPDTVRGWGTLPLATVRVRGGAAIIDSGDIVQIASQPLKIAIDDFPPVAAKIPRGAMYSATGPPALVDSIGGIVWDTGPIPGLGNRWARFNCNTEFYSTNINADLYRNYVNFWVTDLAGNRLAGHKIWANVEHQGAGGSVHWCTGGTSFIFIPGQDVRCMIELVEVQGGMVYRWDPNSSRISVEDAGA
jgi:hypothetical protein